MSLQMYGEETAFKLHVEPITGAELEMEDSLPFSHHSEADILRVLRFVLNYTEDHGINLRGIHLGHAPFEELSTRKLPISYNKATVWRFYKDAAEKLGARVVDLSSFRKMWTYFFPQIVFKEPTTELCLFCHGNKQLSRASLPNALKCVIEQERVQHVIFVEKERMFFQKMNTKCGMVCEDSHLSLGTSSPISKKITMSYSFDYAQQVHYPSNPRQPGPLYFLIPRKCGLFGVCCGGMPKQVSYLMDEGMLPSEPSANFINYLHHFFNNYGVGETYVELNSSEGNRNNCLLWYCAWRTMHKLHLKLDLHFRITGHDMSGPDLLFGLFRQVLRKTRVQTLSDIAGVVRDSTPKKQLNIPQLVGLEDGTVLVEAYDWNMHLKNYFRTFTRIDSYKHFSFDSQRPGVMMAKEQSDSEEIKFELLYHADDRPPIDDLPVQPPPGLSMNRQRYLFEKIREFCSDEGTKNITCPPPKYRA